jgi:hypothetical protein
MSSQLTEEEVTSLMPSELVPHQTPIPTQIVSSDEFYPDPQNERQREVEARLLAMARRVFCHMIFTPGQPGWLDKLDAGLALKPESCKGYTIGDNTHKDISRYPWRLQNHWPWVGWGLCYCARLFLRSLWKETS